MNQIEDASKTLFKRRHFDQEIIILCIRWYLTYKLSYRVLREIMAERGIDLAHTTIMRWVSGMSQHLRNAGSGTLGQWGCRGV